MVEAQLLAVLHDTLDELGVLILDRGVIGCGSAESSSKPSWATIDQQR